MTAPVEFVLARGFDGKILVKVGKSETLRELQISDHDRLVLLASLARWAEQHL